MGRGSAGRSWFAKRARMSDPVGLCVVCDCLIDPGEDLATEITDGRQAHLECLVRAVRSHNRRLILSAVAAVLIGIAGGLLIVAAVQ